MLDYKTAKLHKGRPDLSLGALGAGAPHDNAGSLGAAAPQWGVWGGREPRKNEAGGLGVGNPPRRSPTQV